MCYLFGILTLLQLYEWESGAQSPGRGAPGAPEFAKKQITRRVSNTEAAVPQRRSGKQVGINGSDANAAADLHELAP